MDEDVCTLHHNPHCHYYHDVDSSSVCNKYQHQLNTDVTYRFNNCQEISDHGKDSNKHDYVHNTEIVSGVDTELSANRHRGNKNENLLNAVHDSNTKGYEQCCAHCNCPIKSTFTRELINVNGVSERKESIAASGQVKCFVNSSAYKGMSLYVQKGCINNWYQFLVHKTE